MGFLESLLQEKDILNISSNLVLKSANVMVEATVAILDNKEKNYSLEIEEF